MTSIANINEENGLLQFTLQNVDVSIANAIRRTLLSDIPTTVFRTFGEDKDSNFTVNTSRLNNEILGQRLSCIPIYVSSLDDRNIDIDDLLLEVDEENVSDVVRTVTTADFKIKIISSNEYLSKELCQDVFRPFISPIGEPFYIPFVRLRPRISAEIPGEHVAFTCKFSIGTAAENSMFNVVGTCAYGMTVDENRATALLETLKQTWKTNGLTDAIIERDATNWGLLEKKRITVPNSFDFVVGTVGPIQNGMLIKIACTV